MYDKHTLDILVLEEFKLNRDLYKSSDYVRGWNDAIDAIINNINKSNSERGIT